MDCCYNFGLSTAEGDHLHLVALLEHMIAAEDSDETMMTFTIGIQAVACVSIQDDVESCTGEAKGEMHRTFEES